MLQIGDPLPDSLTGLLTGTPYSYNVIAAASLTPVGGKFNEAGVRREAYNLLFSRHLESNASTDGELWTALRGEQPDS